MLYCTLRYRHVKRKYSRKYATYYSSYEQSIHHQLLFFLSLVKLKRKKNLGKGLRLYLRPLRSGNAEDPIQKDAK